MTTHARRVLVIGGGAAGVVTATTLLRTSHRHRPLRIQIVERGEVVGPGLAYGTGWPGHLLNNVAARMSAVPQDPDHLLRWCRGQGVPATGDTFLLRVLYGRYLAEVVQARAAAPGNHLYRLRGEVVDVAEEDGAYAATLSCGGRLAADSVILALGNPPPRPLRGVADPDKVVDDPWRPDLLDRIGARDRVLFVGTGLTMVDLATQIAAARPDVTMTAVSPHGLLPARHHSQGPRAAAAPTVEPGPLSAVVRLARRQVADASRRGEPWQDVADAWRQCANHVWDRMGGHDRERFTIHVARYWEVFRHRMPPQVGDQVDALVDRGQLSVTAAAQVRDAGHDVVVNCTGPGPVGRRGWNPLVDSLRARGMLREDPLGLGVDLDADGRLRDTDGLSARSLYAVGPARRGSAWEVAAIPDIRRQAAALAHHLCQATVSIDELAS